MKKLIIISLFAVLLSGCNLQVIDTTWRYDYAYINVGDETIKCEVDSWKDYTESDMLQVRCKDGRSFLGHAASIILQSGE
ncbi:MAG: hypothetical protein Q8T08_02855 [Ignavibacteria bacterium]|nr:hypothetical protein [Ignavibacteria bacterium]